MTAKIYMENFTVDTGAYLAKIKLIDEKGKVKTLADYKGKIIYINLWFPSCGPCKVNFEMTPQLIERLQVFHLDTAIQFINIGTVESKKEWKKAVEKIKPFGINLYSSDTATIYHKWGVEGYPHTILLDKSGKIMAKNFVDAMEPMTVDYLLYAATKGIKPAEAIWVKYRQNQFVKKYRTLDFTPDTEGKDYREWYLKVVNKFHEHYLLNEKNKKQK
jgi:hypothetical protein